MAQYVMDLAGKLLFRAAAKSMPKDIRSILVARIDHLGDVFLASSILPHLKKHYPDAKIDFMAGQWAKDFLGTNAYIDKVLVYNSSKHNRAKGVFKKLTDSITGFFKNVRQMRSTRYDLAIDLRAYPFNSIPLIFLGGARYKAGFSTGGFGFLFDKLVPYRTGVHEIDHIRDVLGAIGIDVDKHGLKPQYCPSRYAEKDCVRLLEGLGVAGREKFVLVHTGSGTPHKLWKKEAWQKTVNMITDRYGTRVVMYDPVYEDSITGCVKLPSSISFDTFAEVVKNAALFIGLDSLPAHLAASFGVPTVVVWCGINDHRQWQPLGDNVALVRKALDCAPCFRKNGCQSMHCMDISAQDCLNEITRFLAPPKLPGMEKRLQSEAL